MPGCSSRAICTLKRGSSYAARGQLLPPYDTRATLDRLEAEIAVLNPKTVVLLGDSFHDARAVAALPAATAKFATVGFCWGGGQSFAYAATQPDLAAAVVYYGTPPKDDGLAAIKCPIAGFYGGDDARVTATVDPTTAKMKAAGKVYTPHVFDGAGHGFLRGQAERNGANLKAAQEAWPATVTFLRENTK